MSPLALTSLVAFAASLGLTAVVRRLAMRWGMVDRPDGRRKLHHRPIPRWGGAGVYGATVLGLLALQLIPGAAGAEFVELTTVWIVAAGFVCLVGSIDDRFSLPPRLKLLLQIVSVLPIAMFGYSVDRVVAFGYPIELGWLGIPLTVLWLVGCINALNLIDGMDGLASIVGLSTAAMLGMVAASEGHGHVALLAMVLAASLLGFLVYNLPPASIFLGDSGSMVIGLSIGLLGIQGALKTSATLAVTAPAVAMTLPMFDILAALVRRRLTGRRFDSPDRLHIHHRLLDRGWTPWQVLCLIGAVCLTTGAAATAATIFRRDALAWIIAITLVVVLIRFRLFGYEEFALLKGAIRQKAQSLLVIVRQVLSAIKLGNRLWQAEKNMIVVRPVGQTDGGRPRPASWELLLLNVRTWGIQHLELSISHSGQVRRIRWTDPTAPVDHRCTWSILTSHIGPNGETCDLRAAGIEPIANPPELAALEAMLDAFGQYFAMHSEEIFGPPLAQPHPDHQRKAA